MAEDKKDSFWDRKDDDFWSKPVVSDDWLKAEDDSFWKSSFGADKGTENIPKEKKPEMLVCEQMAVTEETKSVPKKKHVHTKICLIAIGITVFVVFSFVVSAKWNVHEAKRIASKFTGTEQAAGNEILLAGNDVMHLEEVAYTIVPQLSDELWADSVKLLAVYVQLDSSHFKDLRNDDLKPYVGYDTAYGREYKAVYNSWDVDEELLGTYGFTLRHIIYSAVGKGYDSAGYYFFTVPLDVSEIDFYVETYSYQKNCKTVEKTYIKHMQIEEQPDLEELISRKVVH